MSDIDKISSRQFSDTFQIQAVIQCNTSSQILYEYLHKKQEKVDTKVSVG